MTLTITLALTLTLTIIVTLTLTLILTLILTLTLTMAGAMLTRSVRCRVCGGREVTLTLTWLGPLHPADQALAPNPRPNPNARANHNLTRPTSPC